MTWLKKCPTCDLDVDLNVNAECDICGIAEVGYYVCANCESHVYLTQSGDLSVRTWERPQERACRLCRAKDTEPPPKPVIEGEWRWADHLLLA